VSECRSCGADLPAGARFCAFCGAAVEAARAVAEERRTVSILFVDLIGFTERSDRADPEDVRRTLVPFHGRVKEELEAFGGTLDKFIGDAAMGVFGAPVAHEDDPVRAVRAALRIVRSLDDLRRIDPDIAIRVAVNTGEAVVSFGAGPQVGEAVAGDVVNTASRMQSLAPRDSVVIGEDTLAAVRDRFEIEELPASSVKGKREPLRVWRVLGETEAPDVERAGFVGRRDELAALLDRFDEVESSGAAHVATIVADAGVGKSRLVAELGRRLGERAGSVRGVCLPYGEGVTLAPVEQTVRALMGVEPSADVATSHAVLEASAARIEPEERERRWLVSTLDVVLGFAGGTETDADEVAQAWARVLASRTDQRPLLVTIEDLHLSSPAFLEALATAASLLASRPVLFALTTRPGVELPPSWASLPSASSMTVGALDDTETRALLAEVLLGAAVPDATRAAVLERSAGNPLYAIEFARMLADADADAGAGVSETSTPASVQAVIAARLDAIPADVRAIVADAAVIGEEVWPEALASVAGADVAVTRGVLQDLVARGLVEPRTTSFPGLEAFGFAHALIREVAYGRLPRAARARRHLAAAGWLERESGDRVEEWAESLARHYASAAELGAASNERDVADAAGEPARRWLLVAGDRAMRVDPDAAFTTFERALALAPEPTLEREQALERSGLAARRSGRLDAAEILARYEEALAIARARDDGIAIGEMLTRLGSQLAVSGEVERARVALSEAVETLKRFPPGRALARAYAYRAEEELFAGDTSYAAMFADRALSLLEDETDEISVIALHIRGDARCSMGDLEAGIADLEQALARAEASGRVGDIVTSRNYLAEWRWATVGPEAGLAEWGQALELAERRNVHSQAVYTKGSALWVLLELGDWDRVLAWSDDLRALPAGRLDPAVEVIATVMRTHVLLARGRRDEVEDAGAVLALAERTEELAAQAPALSAAAAVAFADGDVDLAVERLEAFASRTEGVAPEYRHLDLLRTVRLSIAAGRRDLAEGLVASSEPSAMRDRLRVDAARAMLAEADGDPDAATAYGEVAERLRTYGDPFEEAMALLGRARLAGDEDARSRGEALLAGLGVVGG
jgi:class 3 adenylate cyclase/tetratricopeptide (TPR) repeat protein